MTAPFDYHRRVDSALRRVIRDVLSDVARDGLPEGSHFYLTFRTDCDGVEVAERLRQDYPEEMTVVLQHQFWDLVVDDDAFAVTLRFGGVEERLRVPWQALSVFADPPAEFGLRLENTSAASPAPPVARPAAESAPSAAGDVVRIEDFRRERGS